MWTLYLSSQSKRSDITPEWLSRVAEALTEQLADVAVDHGVVKWTVTTTPTPGAYPLTVLDVSDEPGAAGYHDNPDNAPRGRIFCENEPLSEVEVTASHEAVELALDPDTQGFSLAADGKARAKEGCDAVEDLTYPASNGVMLSDYILPAWFVAGSMGPWDKMGKLTGPLTKTGGGYVIVLENGQVTTDPPEARAKSARKAHPLSRTSRRCGRVAT